MQRPSLIGGALLIGISGFAVYGLTFPPNAGRERIAQPYETPRGGLPLGADDLGRSLFDQLAVGASGSLALALLVAAFVTIAAAVVGGAAAIGPRWLSAVLMRGVDVMLILPELVLVILAAAFLGQTFTWRVAIIAVILWPAPARIVRAAALTALSRGHLEVARAMGSPWWRLLARHVSYTVGPVLIPVFIRGAMVAVLFDATLAFLGLGDPTSASWGTTLHWAQISGAFLSDAWLWWAVPPGVAITLTMVGLALVGVAVEDRINPALRRAT